MKLSNIMSRGWYLAPDELTGGGAAATAEETAAAEAAATAAASAAASAAAAANTQLTPEQIEERAYAATQRALTDAQRNYAAEQEQAQRGQQQPRWDPTADAMDAIDIRTDMYESALALYPDLPAEARQEVKDKLRQIKTVDGLRGAQKNNIHELIADAAYGKAVRTGKIQPKTVTAPAREPAHSEPDIQVSAGMNSELNELEALLGVKFDESERKSLARNSGAYN
jgi:hypothetical protein